MRKVILFTALLLAGLGLSQVVAHAAPGAHAFTNGVRLLTMAALSFIMIHVGYEFEIDKSRLRRYGWDYFIAFSAATVPWIFVTLYFVFVMTPRGSWAGWQAWQETLLAGRFAAPTSAGVLFTMLAAAGLGATWVFHKARVLAIFDDLDTVLLMIPLQMMMVGLVWQLGVVLVIVIAVVAAAYHWLHRLAIPVAWNWVLGYALVITLASESVYVVTRAVDPAMGVHLEVLLPAFALGCVMRRHPLDTLQLAEDLEGPEGRGEAIADSAVSAAFMFLVGLSMPPIFGDSGEEAATLTAAQPMPGWEMIAGHVLAVTLLSNLGKLAPMFCYRDEATFKERVAVAVAMWPRGEVGAGILVISLSYGVGGPVITVALLSLALNLSLTAIFIVIVKRLLAEVPAPEDRAMRPES
ncbi:MAG: sodium:proton antiporter [Candidatus Sumerlaeia bacterium]